jgi:hypothetical protein
MGRKVAEERLDRVVISVWETERSVCTFQSSRLLENVASGASRSQARRANLDAESHSTRIAVTLGKISGRICMVGRQCQDLHTPRTKPPPSFSSVSVPVGPLITYCWLKLCGFTHHGTKGTALKTVQLPAAGIPKWLCFGNYTKPQWKARNFLKVLCVIEKKQIYLLQTFCDD